MWIVTYTNDNTRHSAWDTRGEAENQARVLRESGYRNVKIEFDGTVVAANGHYYV